MIDIKNHPYFSYGHILDVLMKPITDHVDLRFITFDRKFANQTRFVIAQDQEAINDYYKQGLYKHGLFETDSTTLESGFHMWDHLPCDPNGIYEFMKRFHNQAHGLTIIKQHGGYCDFFLFATIPHNSSVNNFYLNRKDLFEQFIEDFYQTLSVEIEILSSHRISVPYRTMEVESVHLSPRQQECAILMLEGFTTKEIARALDLSPRTVQEYIDIIKDKFDARNRLHLQGMLKKHL